MWTRARSRRLYCAAIAALFVLAGAAPARADEDLEVFRERFRVGLEKYNERRFAEAIVIWEGIYRELGPKRGYRLAFNLGRAYDAYGDSTRAAESFESYLGEVEARRAAKEDLEPVVLKQEADARERLGELGRDKGRIKLVAKKGIVVQIDAGEPRLSGFTAYVAPGEHRVTFEPTTTVTRVVAVKVAAGEEVTAADPGPPPENPPPPPPPPPRVEYIKVVDRPFPSWVLFAVGAGTVASAPVPFFMFDHATTLKDRYYSITDVSQRNDAEQLKSDYGAARTAAYATYAIPITLAAATAGLAAWYFLASKEREVPRTAARR